MKFFSQELISDLEDKANANERKRQHLNIHENYSDSCQCFLNAIQPRSYIRPHRHLLDSRNEILVAVRGLMAVIIFDDLGKITKTAKIGSEKYKSIANILIEITPDIWHTVVSLKKGSILLEVKPGPFVEDLAKEYAPWAPEEGSRSTASYHTKLVASIK